MIQLRIGGSVPAVVQRRLFSTTAYIRLAADRRYESNLDGYDRHVAVIGGGITGLTAAYRLSEDPRTHVTLYEKEPRLGGWLQSEYVAAGEKRVLFEFGPRTFRLGFFSALATLELLSDLGLMDQLSVIKGTGARYIYHQDHLERLPGPDQGILGNLWTLARSRFLRKLIYGAAEAFSMSTKSRAEDQSLGEYLENQFGKDFVNDFASAIIHGIYAADIYKLDARKVLPGPVVAEQHMSILRYLRLSGRMTCVNTDVTKHLGYSLQGAVRSQQNWVTEAVNVCQTGSIAMLKGGMSSLTNRIVKRLSWADNVDVKVGTEVISISNNAGEKSVRVSVRGGRFKTYHSVCSTTSSAVLQKQLGRSPTFRFNSSVNEDEAFENLNGSVSVMVVNLYYDTPNITPPGFGYLIPESVPFDQNPERALGVIFPPPQEAEQDDSTGGTKIGVLLGGHWWDDWDISNLPSEEEGIQMAKNILQRR
ncbi:oxygen-dependent protoporphyrinogen oxidase, partial [Ascosphaera aggregata]